MLGLAPFVLAGCNAVKNQQGFFYSTFVKPMRFLLDFFSNHVFNGSYGVAIILITVLIRLILMPFMLKNYKNQQGMKEKMDKLKPEMDEIQQKLKAAKTKEEQMALQQEMMGLYKKHNVNPMNMGCLPVIIQMPIIMGLYYAILYSGEVKAHHFLWYELGKPDIVMTLIAGVVYFVQAQVSLWTVPEQQKSQMKMMMYISPIMIMFISFSSMSALPLYWSVSGAILIFQTYLGRKFYSQHPEKATKEVAKATDEDRKLTPAEKQAAKSAKKKSKK